MAIVMHALCITQRGPKALVFGLLLDEEIAQPGEVYALSFFVSSLGKRTV